MRRLRLGMAQINTTVGDFKGNTEKILKAIAEGSALGVTSSHFPSLPSAATRRRPTAQARIPEGCPSQTGSRAARASFWPYPLLASTK